jgi:arylamine N-acetyltransferase
MDEERVIWSKDILPCNLANPPLVSHLGCTTMTQSSPLSPARPDFDDVWTSRYLDLLDVRDSSPSLSHLTALIDAQFRTVPFENVTSLSRRLDTAEGPVPEIDRAQLLANWEAKRGGGVCYEIVSMFHNLLLNLGYDVRLILAQISFPDGHQALIVTLEGVDCLVDVGTGSPVFRPISLNGPDAIECAGVRFRFRADETDSRYWLQERLIDGEWKRSCRYDLEPPSEQRREDAYQLHHTMGSSWVVDTLRMACWRNNIGYSISGNQLTILKESGKELIQLDTPEQYREIVSRPDAYNVPNLPLERVFRDHPTYAPLGEAGTG